MRLAFPALIALALLAPPARADDELLPSRFEVGQVGRFALRGTPYRVRVERVVDGKTLIVGPEVGAAHSWVVRGLDTSRLADDKVITLPGRWKITKTERRGGRTLYVAERLP